MKDKKLISLELSEELLSKVKVQAEKDEVSMSTFIRLALKAYLKERDEK